MQSPSRILAIDWLRGIAVLWMIECHALALLQPSLDASPVKQFLQQFNGLVAPAFLFAAGFALALTSGRVWKDVLEKRARAKRSLGRIGVILLVSLVMHELAWGAISIFWERLMWPDVLMCIGLCLAMVWAVLFLLPRPVHAPALVGLLAAVLLLAPVLPGRELGFFTPWLNNSRHWNTFPTVPMGSNVFWGAIVGWFAARSPHRRRAIVIGMAVSLVVGWGIAHAGGIATQVYNGLNPYNLISMGERAWKVSLVALLLLAIEPIYAGRLWWPVSLLGTESLTAYVAHLLLLFGLGPIDLLRPYRAASSWANYAVILPVLIAATLGVCVALKWGMNWRKPRASVPAKANA